MQVQRAVMVIAIVAGLIGGLFSCSAKTPATKKEAAVQTATSGSAVSTDTTTSDRKASGKTILFFMNPNGHPCQMQKAILDGMNEKLAGLAKVTYVKITERSDRDMFSKFGIRGLPSLIIVDADGHEIYRFATGIQDEETILAALQKKNTP